VAPLATAELDSDPPVSIEINRPLILSGAVPKDCGMTTNGGIEPGATGRAAGGRAQSETIGVVLVVAIVISGATLVVVIGATAISDTEDQLADSRAEKGMTQFSSKAGLVALQEADSQQIDFATDRGEQYNVVPDTGWMNITWQNQTTGYSEEVMNMTLGAVVYEGKNRRFAYQGGGVFQETDTGGQMISPPEFHFRDGTLTLPAVNVTGDPALGGRATVTRSDVIRKFPTGVDNSTNPLDNHVVTVTVQSDYYRGWGEYFEERTDGEVEYDHAAETATLLMVTPIELTKITAASSSLSASGSFKLHGDPAGARYTDSYNSSQGPYDPTTAGKEGDLIYTGDIDLTGGSGNNDIWGDIESGNDVKVGSGGGQPYINGNISHAQRCLPSNTECESRITDPDGDRTKIDRVETASSVNWFVNNSISEIEDNADETNPVLSDGQDLNKSTYYFDSLVVPDDNKIKLNTTENDIKIGVRENVKLNNDGSDGAILNVTGDGIVRVFVGGEGIGSAEELDLANHAEIITPDDNATQFRMYGKSDFEAEIGDSAGSGNPAKYVGVIYAPPGQGGTGKVTVLGSELFGGILTGTTILDKGSIHYDEALREKLIIPPDANQVKVTFLHVTINRITVEG
jgi:flagellin-like protein